MIVVPLLPPSTDCLAAGSNRVLKSTRRRTPWRKHARYAGMGPAALSSDRRPRVRPHSVSDAVSQSVTTLPPFMLETWLMQSAHVQTDELMPAGDLSSDPFRAGRASLRLEALGLMTAGIVHDLGNVMQILSSTVDVLEQHPTIRTSQALRPTVARAVTSLERASALIKQILGFARETGSKKESVDLALCLAGMERFLRWLCKSDMRIDIQVGADVPPVICHRWNLENAILNLALNARDAMPWSGVLSIRATPSRDSNRIVTGVALRFSDNGCGMTQETLAQAFDPFFTTKSGARGTGLGLTMVRRFAQEAGGNVTIESTLGLGTTVTLRLPLQPRLQG